MPPQRLIHPRIGDSQKIASLTDRAFRVWITYLWVADDWGVMPFDATKIQGGNRRLAQYKRRLIDEDLGSLVELELLTRYDIAGEPFVCSLNWQTHQNMKWPRATETYWPPPPPDVIQRCDRQTQALFRKHPKFSPPDDSSGSGGAPGEPDGGGSEVPPSTSGNFEVLRGTSQLARAGTRKTLSLTPDANAGERGSGGDSDDGIDSVLVHYAEAFLDTTSVKPQIDQFTDRVIVGELVAEHGVDTVKRAISAMFRFGDAFVERAGFNLRLFRKQFNSFATLAAKHAPSHWCEHEPACRNLSEHTMRILNTARLERGEAPLGEVH